MKWKYNVYVSRNGFLPLDWAWGYDTLAAASIAAREFTGDYPWVVVHGPRGGLRWEYRA